MNHTTKAQRINERHDAIWAKVDPIEARCAELNANRQLLCPQCSSANTVWYAGALGYEAIRCRDCNTETDANNQSSHRPWPEVTK